MNFSEWKGLRQTIFFAASDDLVHWDRLGSEYEFVPDERWYEDRGRWDCIWTIPRPDGGLYGYWTASPKPETGEPAEEPVRMLPKAFDATRGLLLECRLILPPTPFTARRGLYIECADAGGLETITPSIDSPK